MRAQRPAAGDLGRGAGHHQGDRGVLSARGPPALPGASHAQLGRQGAGVYQAGFQGARANGLPGAEPRDCAQARGWRLVADYGREQERGVACFMEDFEACIAHLRFPVTHRWAIRTTNLLERVFIEERRRLKIIPNTFGEKAILKLKFGALIRAAERWRSVKITEFERRQTAAVRKEFDLEYEAMVGLNAKPSKDAA